MPDSPAPAEVQAPQNDPSLAQAITGLPTEGNLIPRTGTIADLLRGGHTEEKPSEGDDKEKAKQNLEKADEAVRKALFGRVKKDKKKDEEKKPDEPKPEATAEPPKPEETVEVKPESKPEPKPKKTVVVKTKAEEIAERYAELERQRLALEREKLELEKQKQVKPSAEVDLSMLSPDEQYELEVFQQMGKMDQKYADLHKRFLQAAKARADYKAKWERENDGEVFNPDDSAHDAFFAKNTIEYNKRDFKKAEHRLAEGDTPRVDENTQRELNELKADKKLREVMPRAFEVVHNSVQSLFSSIDPAIWDSAKKGGRESLLNDFPVESDALLKAASDLEAVAVEAHRILETDGLIPIDHSNPVHRIILDVIYRKEAANAAAGVTDEHGRPFATWQQWGKMSPLQRQNYWHMGAPEVADVFQQELAAIVKRELDRINKLAEIKANKGKSQAAPAPTETRTQKPPPAAPGSASKSTVDTSSKGKPTEETQMGKLASNILFRRSS